MNVRAILAIARKDAVEVLFQRALLYNLALPPLLTVAYLFISALVAQFTQSPASLLIYNPGGSNLAQVVGAAFVESTVVPAESAEQVRAAFGPDGSLKRTSYSLGLIIPANFETDLRAGRRPQLSLFLNHDLVGPVTTGSLQAAISSYAHTAVDPQSPVELTLAVINPATGAATGFSFVKYYAALSLLISLMVGTAFVPALLIEEREKKTLRVLLVMPASYADVIASKVVVALGYQLAITGLVLVITGGFLGLSAQLPLIALYAVLGAGFSVSVGLLFGALFQSSGAAATAGGLTSTLYILAGIFSGPWTVWVGGDTPVQAVARLFPTYYLADGAYNAWQNVGSLSSHALNLGVLLGASLIVFGVAAWLLQRQAVYAAAL